MKNSIAMVIVFALGCATASVVAPLIVPKAQAGGNTQRWEQLCVPAEDEAGGPVYVKHSYSHAVNLPTGWNPVIKKYGAEGWEMVSTNQYVSGGTVPRIGSVCFKRPM